MTDTQRISLHLDAHTVVLNVERDKEAVYRNAATKLNTLYRHYQKTFPSYSAEQLWVYVALHLGVNLVSDAREKSIEPVENQLKALNQQLLEVLAKNNENTN